MLAFAGLSLVGALGLGPALGLYGCTVSENFDPTGGDVAVNATWTVEGAAASAESCRDAGIGVVRLRVWEQYAGGDDYTEDGWVVQCSAGSLTTQPILVAGTYRVGVYGVAIPDAGVPEGTDAAVIGDAGFPPDTSDVEAAALVEASAEAGGTLSVSLDLSPPMGE